MNFETMTAEQAVAEMEGLSEGDKWEFKAADFLLKNKHDLKKELGKQVSAFANSGGGRIVLGVKEDKDTNNFNPDFIDLSWKGQPLKDHLGNLIEQAVDYPVKSCAVIPCSSSSDSQTGLCVIEVGDSPLAPHQCKEDYLYYWRLDGRSKPAPHFYLESLRNRLTKTELSLRTEHLEVEKFERKEDGRVYVRIKVTMNVKNSSFQAASNWGLHVDGTTSEWNLINDRRKLYAGKVFVPGHGVLLPEQEEPIAFHLDTIHELDLATMVSNFERSEAWTIWEQIRLVLRPVSQNNISSPVHFPSEDREESTNQLMKYRHLMTEQAKMLRHIESL